MKTRLDVLWSFAISCMIACVSSDNILLVPFTDGSHIIQMDALGTPLLNRGHKVHVLLQAGFSMPQNTDNRYVLVHFGEAKSDEQLAELTRHNNAGGPTLEDMKAIVDYSCTEMVTDGTLWQRLASLKLDLIVVDYFLLACYYLLPFKLRVPFVTLSSGVPMFDARMSVLPSVTSYMVEVERVGPIQCHSGSLPLPGMLERVCRLASHLLNEFTPVLFETDLHAYENYPALSLLRSNLSLALINNSPLLGAVFPTTPNTVYVGGITAKPASPLPSELQAWMDQADDVVVVSFGSRFTRLANSGNEKLLAAFAALPYRFVVRFKTKEYRDVQLPKNVKLADWLPQNDVVGHEHTHLLITHCGLNGLFEALYHAVPVICLHIHTDQPANGRKIERLGFGFAKEASEFESEWIVEKVEELISNSSYRARIQAASKIFLSQQNPSEKAADAVEHVLRFGSDHLRPHEALELTWWQFYMLDVIAVLYTIVLVLLYVFYKVVTSISKFILRITRLK